MKRYEGAIKVRRSTTKKVCKFFIFFSWRRIFTVLTTTVISACLFPAEGIHLNFLVKFPVSTQKPRPLSNCFANAGVSAPCEPSHAPWQGAEESMLRFLGRCFFFCDCDNVTRVGAKKIIAREIGTRNIHHL